MSPNSKESQDLKKLQLQAHLEEYRALRAEQTRKVSNQQNLTYLIIILLAAVIGVASSIPSLERLEIKRELSYILLFTPILTSALVFLYLDHEVMVIRIGRYISKNLRKKVSRLTLASNLWEWDEYHRKESQKRLFTTGLIAFLSRWVLMSSTAGPLILYRALFPPPYDIVQKTLLIADFILLLFMVISNCIVGRYFFKEKTAAK